MFILIEKTIDVLIPLADFICDIEKYVIVFVFVCFSLMSLDLFLALLFDFAQECKRLSVRGFDVSSFSHIS